MKVAIRRDNLDFSDLLYVNIDAYMPHIYMLQLTAILLPVTNGPLYTTEILKKYFPKSTLTIFTFPCLNTIF